MRGALAPLLGGGGAPLAARLDAMARAAEALPPPALVHRERVDGEAEPVICRVENFCAPMADSWGAVARGAVGGIVAQLYKEPAALFKDKINYKMPGGGGFLCHQDATACVRLSPPPESRPFSLVDVSESEPLTNLTPASSGTRPTRSRATTSRRSSRSTPRRPRTAASRSRAAATARACCRTRAA